MWRRWRARHGGTARRGDHDLRRPRRGDRPLHLEPPAGHPRRPVHPRYDRHRGPVLVLGLDRLHPARGGRGARGRPYACGRLHGLHLGEDGRGRVRAARGRAAGHGRLRGRRPQVRPPPPGRPADHLRRFRQAVQAGGGTPGPALGPLPGGQGLPGGAGPRGRRDEALAAEVAEANTGLAALQLCRRRAYRWETWWRRGPGTRRWCAAGAPVAVDVICIDRAGTVVGRSTPR